MDKYNSAIAQPPEVPPCLRTTLQPRRPGKAAKRTLWTIPAQVMLRWSRTAATAGAAVARSLVLTTPRAGHLESRFSAVVIWTLAPITLPARQSAPLKEVVLFSLA